MFRPWEIDENIPSCAAVQDMDSDDDNDSDRGDCVRRRHHLSEDAKAIVRNVHKNLVNRQCSHPIKVTSEMTEVPYTTVQNIIKNVGVEKNRNSKKFRKIDENLGLEIKNTIYDSYKKNIVPTTKSILKTLNEKRFDISYSEETFRLYLRSLGFVYKNINQRAAIMESERLKRHRFQYIQDIRKYRAEGRPIIYLDETWYDTHDIQNRGLNDGSSSCILNVPPSRGKRIIILHAGYANGWIPGALLLSAKNIKNCSADYHQEMDGPLFETWFENQLLPNVPANSVIVMDNAKYHSRQLSKKPNQNTRKNDILHYMRSNNIALPTGKMTKKDLLEVVKNLEHPTRYIVDDLAAINGHTVLRLPPYYCVLNPIEMIWGTLKRAIRKNNISPNLSSGVVELIRKEVCNVRSETWKNSVRHVIDVENQYVSPDVQEFIINVDCDSDSDDKDLDESEDDIDDL